VGLAGYVSTNYGERPLPDVVADIRAWYDQHSGQMSGIFLDEYAEKVCPLNGSLAHSADVQTSLLDARHASPPPQSLQRLPCMN
jgi:Spherulation-specific family 4